MNLIKNIDKKFLQKHTQIIFLIVIILVFFIISPSFRTFGNMINIIKQVTVIGTISCGMTFVILTGCLDLSVGSVFSLLSLLTILTQQRNDCLAVVVPLISSIFIGLFNGIIIAKFKVNSIIATLGSLSLFSGLSLFVTNGAIIMGNSGTWFSIIGTGTIWGIPNHVFVFVILAFIFHILLTQFSFGRKLKYVGTNDTAAEIVGIKVDNIRILAYIISSLSVAIAVLIYTSRMSTASPTAGSGFEFDAITAVIVGGTSLDGGRGSIFNTIIGVLLLAIIVNILTLYNISYSYQSIVKGLLIIGAISIDIRVRRK